MARYDVEEALSMLYDSSLTLVGRKTLRSVKIFPCLFPMKIIQKM